MLNIAEFLLSEGFAHIDDIIKLLFNYVGLLKQSGSLRRWWDEMAQIYKILFTYKVTAAIWHHLWLCRPIWKLISNLDRARRLEKTDFLVYRSFGSFRFSLRESIVMQQQFTEFRICHEIIIRVVLFLTCLRLIVPIHFFQSHFPSFVDYIAWWDTSWELSKKFFEVNEMKMPANF